MGVFVAHEPYKGSEKMTISTKLKGRIKNGLLALVLSLLIPLPAHALRLEFNNITGNIAGDAAIGEAQLYVDVTDAGDGQVSFTFGNTGDGACSITGVYFDDGAFLDAIDSINSSGGVSFSEDANPGELPGAKDATPPFITTAGLLADSNSPVQPNGVNPGEWLGITFDLLIGTDFSAVLAGLASGALRIGIHVQGFDGGGSESFVNVPVPEPSSILFMSVGITGWAVFGRKRFNNKIAH